MTPKFRAALYPAPSGQRCFSLLLPDDDSFVQLVAGLYALTTDAKNWYGDEADCDVLAQAFLDAYTAMDWSACLTSQWLVANTRIFPTQLSAITGDDPVFTGNSGTDGGGWWSQPTPAINDSMSWKVALKAGMYTLRLTAIKSNSDGKVQINLLGVPEIDVDLYSASFVPNFSEVSGTIEIADDDVYTVTSLVYGKNAASAGYRLGLQYIDLFRTGDV